jgi:hypothetical protein
VYRKQVLDIVLPWAKEHFGDRSCTFQQDSAPAHKAKKTQQLLAKETPNFIAVDEWPPYSPDLSPLDFCVNPLLEAMACQKPHKDVKRLKKALQAAWQKLPMKTLKKAADSFPKRLKKCIAARGSRFE